MGLANLNLQSLIGGSVADAFAKVVGVFKVDPSAKLNAETELQKIQLALQGKLQDAISNEITASAEIIKSEAQSQSWLPRNVRPLLLLLWVCSSRSTTYYHCSRISSPRSKACNPSCFPT